MSNNSGYRIGLVEYENFMPFASAQIDFSVPGVTVVEGEILNVPGCENNGAGKSCCLEGPVWAFYGRCIREKYKGDDVVALGSTGGCRVRVNLVGGDQPVVVERFRKHPLHKDRVYLLVGKNATYTDSPGTNTETELKIEELLGMSFMTFVNTVAFGAREDIKGFFSASDADRKAILENVLGLALYADAEVIARKRLKILVGKLNVLSSEFTTLEQRATEKQEVVARFREQAESNDAALALAELKLRAKQTGDAVKKSSAVVAKIKAELTQVAAQFQIKQGAFTDAFKTYSDAKGALQQEIGDLKGEIGKVVGQVQSLKVRKAKLVKSSGAECPQCGQEIKPAHVKSASVALEAEIAKLEHSLTCFDMEVDQRKNKVEALTAPVAPDNEAVTEKKLQCNQAASALEKHMAVEVEAKRQLVKAQADYDASTQQLDALEAEANALTTEAAGKHAEYDLLNQDAAKLEFWVTGFGNQGLKSYLIEAEIPEINKNATGFVHRFLGNGAYVRLSATKQNKTNAVVKDELTVQGVIPGMTRTYAGASKGQKRRMDLAILLGFWRVTSSRASKRFNQLFFDELFDGLDRTGSESVVELLRELAEDRPVIVVSQDDRIKCAGARIVLVKHNGDPVKGRATIVGGASATAKVATPKVAVLKKKG